MYKTFGNILFIFVILSCLIIDIPFAFAKDRTFKGKVIDFETKQPIEGAVVVAYWYEERETGTSTDTRLKEVKETLTDKNGEWSMTGEEGEPYNPNPYLSLFLGIYYTTHPSFIIFKPGYEPYGATTWGPVSFQARPYVDKEQGLEGIIVYINGKYDQKIREIDPSTAYLWGSLFIPMKDPETKLKNLDIPFDYPDDVKRIFTKREKSFKYTVIGLKKLRTREERLKAMPSPDYGTDPNKRVIFLRDQKEYLRLLNEENKNLGLSENKMYKEIIDEK